MGNICPKCQTENTSDSQFCKKCATPLPGIKDASFTKTIETPVDSLSRGSLFAGRYEIIEELGKGGMGRVFKVLDTQINEEIALKLIRPEIAADEKVIDRFRDELKIARKVSHKHICRTHDINEVDGKPFITMEYVKGDDLKSLIREYKILPQDKVISIAKQVCEGLAAAHEMGIVHRDLKPQNIIIDENGQAKIMDFGIARSVEVGGKTQTGVMIGTPDYMSPEQVEGKEADQRADIYALGVILYEMGTGTVPFRGDTALSVALKHKTALPKEPKKINPRISDDLNRLILICLEKDREKRYQTANSLLSDMQNIEDGFPLGSKIRPRRKTFISALIEKKIFVPALVAVLALISIAIWQLLPKKESALNSSGKPSLAVMYFENRSEDQELDEVIIDLLTANLGRFAEIEVIGRHRLFDILHQIGKKNIEIIDQNNATEIAKYAGLKMMLIGGIIETGDKVRITSQLTDVQTGAIVGSDQVEGTRGADTFLMVDELTEKVRMSLHIDPEGYQPFKVSDITTSSEDAYRHYRKGREATIRWDFMAAIKDFQRAIDLDPTFALAHLYMAVAYSGYGIQLRNPYNSFTQIRNAISSAKKYRAKANDKERRLIDVYEALFNRNYETAFLLSSDLVTYYPNDKDVSLLHALAALKAKRFDQSIEAYERTVEIDPSFDEAYLEQAYAYSRINDHEAAISAIKTHIALLPDAWNPYDSAWEIYMRAGQFDEAIRACEAGLKIDAELSNLLRFYEYQAYAYLFKGENKKAFDLLNQASGLDPEGKLLPKGFLPRWTANRLAVLLLYEGKYDEALTKFQFTVEIARNVQNLISEIGAHGNKGKMYAEKCQYDKALGEYQEFEKLSLQIPYPPLFKPYSIYADYLAGIAMVKKKDYEAVLDFAEKMKNTIDGGNYDAIHEDFYHLLMAELYVSKGEPGAAKEALEKVSSDGEFFSPRYKVLLASSHSLEGDFEKAIEIYSNFMNSIDTAQYSMGDRVLFFIERSKIDYNLAKIFDLQGQTAKAIEFYQKFLDLFKNADPGIKEVEDAKKRLARLE